MTETETYTVWQLARMASCADPDHQDSPGAHWLTTVADSAKEVTNEDEVSETADSVVPIYTVERWRVFVDLGAWEEDVTELGADASDLTQCAAIALYQIAERLLTAVVEARDDAEDDDTEESAD